MTANLGGIIVVDAAKPGRVVLIDGMSLLFRAFYAPMQTALTSPSGMPTKAVYIFLRTVRKLLKDYKPDKVAVAFDKAGPTFRDQLFEKYKSNRPPFPEELSRSEEHTSELQSPLNLVC